MKRLISNPYTDLYVEQEDGKSYMHFVDYDERYTVRISESFYLEMKNIIEKLENQQLLKAAENVVKYYQDKYYPTTHINIYEELKKEIEKTKGAGINESWI